MFFDEPAQHNVLLYYVHAHNLAVTSLHSELKYDAGLLASALAMYVPLVAKGPTFPSC